MVEGQGMVLIKLGGEIFGTTVSAIIGVVTASDNGALTVTAIGGVLTFAGLLVRQVVKSQDAVWKINAAKDVRIEELEERDHYRSWEFETLRFRYGERQMDPGPYVPRVKAGT